MTADAKPTLVVTAAVVERRGAFLITRRPAGSHLEGLWEFPGGKLEAGETPAEGLAREIGEELGVRAVVGAEILRTSHAYPDRIVELRFFECRLAGPPRPLLGQEIRWVRGGDLPALEFPPADAELVARLAGNPRRDGLDDQGRRTTKGRRTRRPADGPEAPSISTEVPGSADSRRR